MRIEISGGTATVYADTNRRPSIAARLIAAAGPGRAGVVRTVTGGNTLAFSAPLEVVRAAGLLPEQVDALKPVAPEPKAGEAEDTKQEPKPVAKTRTRKAAESDAQ